MFCLTSAAIFVVIDVHVIFAANALALFVFPFLKCVSHWNGSLSNPGITKHNLAVFFIQANLALMASWQSASNFMMRVFEIENVPGTSKPQLVQDLHAVLSKYGLDAVDLNVSKQCDQDQS